MYSCKASLSKLVVNITFQIYKKFGLELQFYFVAYLQLRKWAKTQTSCSRSVACVWWLATMATSPVAAFCGSTLGELLAAQPSCPYYCCDWTDLNCSWLSQLVSATRIHSRGSNLLRFWASLQNSTITCCRFRYFLYSHSFLQSTKHYCRRRRSESLRHFKSQHCSKPTPHAAPWSEWAHGCQGGWCVRLGGCSDCYIHLHCNLLPGMLR